MVLQPWSRNSEEGSRKGVDRLLTAAIAVTRTITGAMRTRTKVTTRITMMTKMGKMALIPAMRKAKKTRITRMTTMTKKKKMSAPIAGTKKTMNIIMTTVEEARKTAMGIGRETAMEEEGSRAGTEKTSGVSPAKAVALTGAAEARAKETITGKGVIPAIHRHPEGITDQGKEGTHKVILPVARADRPVRREVLPETAIIIRPMGAAKILPMDAAREIRVGGVPVGEIQGMVMGIQATGIPGSLVIPADNSAADRGDPDMEAVPAAGRIAGRYVFL